MNKAPLLAIVYRSGGIQAQGQRDRRGRHVAGGGPELDDGIQGRVGSRLAAQHVGVLAGLWPNEKERVAQRGIGQGRRRPELQSGHDPHGSFVANCSSRVPQRQSIPLRIPAAAGTARSLWQSLRRRPGAPCLASAAPPPGCRWAVPLSSYRLAAPRPDCPSG